VHPFDVCATCGHLREQHTVRMGSETCMCWMPWRRPDATKNLPSLRDLSPIDYATELPLRTKAKGSVNDWTSAICNCTGFVASGLRFQPEADEEDRRAVRDGRKRRTLIEV